MAVQPQQGPTGYPRAWAPKGSPPPDEPPSFEALQLCIDAFVAALSTEEFDALVLRTRGDTQQQQTQYGQQQPQQGQQQPMQQRGF